MILSLSFKERREVGSPTVISLPAWRARESLRTLVFGFVWRTSLLYRPTLPYPYSAIWVRWIECSNDSLSLLIPPLSQRVNLCWHCKVKVRRALSRMPLPKITTMDPLKVSLPEIQVLHSHLVLCLFQQPQCCLTHTIFYLYRLRPHF